MSHNVKELTGDDIQQNHYGFAVKVLDCVRDPENSSCKVIGFLLQGIYSCMNLIIVEDSQGNLIYKVSSDFATLWRRN